MTDELITPESPEVLKQAEHTGTAPATVATVLRIAAATKEARALKEWQRTCVGDRPVTPNLTAIQEGATIMKASKKSTAVRTERVVDYTKNGVLPSQKKPWTLGYVAYFCTAGIDKKSPARIDTTALEALLAKLGVDDPRQPGWEVELPNGVKVGAVPIGSLGEWSSTPKATTTSAPDKGKQLIPSPKARVARKSAATRAKTTARKTKGADPKVARSQPSTKSLGSLVTI